MLFVKCFFFSRAIVPTESIHILSFRSQLKCFNFNAIASVGNGRHWHVNKLFVVVAAAATAICNSHRVQCLLSALLHSIATSTNFKWHLKCHFYHRCFLLLLLLYSQIHAWIFHWISIKMILQKTQRNSLSNANKSKQRNEQEKMLCIVR